MKLKNKIKSKHRVLILYVFTFLICASSLFLLYDFMDTYVYGSFFVDDDFLKSSSQTATLDINMDLFNEVSENLSAKTIKKSYDINRNIFK